jgi:hypothetical protein
MAIGVGLTDGRIEPAQACIVLGGSAVDLVIVVEAAACAGGACIHGHGILLC